MQPSVSRRHPWWDAALLATAAICAALVGTQADPPQRWPGLLALGGIVAVWFALGRWALLETGRDHEARVATTMGAAFVLVTALLLAVVCRAYPGGAGMLAVLCPYSWNWSRHLRDILAANLALTGAVAIGTPWGLGWTGDAWASGGITAGASLLFSLAMGAWIASVAGAARREGRLQAELAAANDELTELHRRAGAAAERERLARELHDTLTQTLTAVVMLAERAGEQMSGGAHLAPDSARTVALLERTARQALAETRSIIAEGSAPGVGEDGLPARLDRITRSFAVETGTEARFSAVPAAPELDRSTEVVLLRVAQEALANVRKHAAAGSVRVELRQDDQETTLSVADDGRGFPDSVAVAQQRGSGLRGIETRLALATGQLSVTTGAHGTQLRVRLPRAAGPERTAGQGAA